ncbi:MAG: YciI family protein [Gemmatimonadales bacterium]
MTSLPRETQPDPALEERVVSTLVAAGLVRRRRVWRAWVAVAAAVTLLTVGVTMVRPTHTLVQGRTYVVMLYEDSTYRPAPPGHGAERVAVIARWADSLGAIGKLERAGRLVGPGPLGGLIIVRATSDSDAAQIAASCPFTEWGGHVEIKRFE